MAQRIETITRHVFAFDDDEITVILSALYDTGEEDLATAIYAELPCDCEVEYSGDENADFEELIDAIRKFTGAE